MVKNMKIPQRDDFRVGDLVVMVDKRECDGQGLPVPGHIRTCHRFFDLTLKVDNIQEVVLRVSNGKETILGYPWRFRHVEITAPDTLFVWAEIEREVLADEKQQV